MLKTLWPLFFCWTSGNGNPLQYSCLENPQSLAACSPWDCGVGPDWACTRGRLIYKTGWWETAFRIATAIEHMCWVLVRLLGLRWLQGLLNLRSGGVMRLYELTERTNRRNGVSAPHLDMWTSLRTWWREGMETDRAVLTQDVMLWARKQPEPGRDLFRPLLHRCLYFDGCSKTTSFRSVRRWKAWQEYQSPAVGLVWWGWGQSLKTLCEAKCHGEWEVSGTKRQVCQGPWARRHIGEKPWRVWHSC